MPLDRAATRGHGGPAPTYGTSNQPDAPSASRRPRRDRERGGGQRCAADWRRRRRRRRQRPPRQPRPRPLRPCGAAEAAAPAAEEAPPRPRPPRPLPARLRLLDLRDHDGGRPGPAEAGEPPAVPRRPELEGLRPIRRVPDHPDRERAPHPGRVRRDLPDHEAGRDRDRGRALLRPPRHRRDRHRPRRDQGHRRPRRRPGRLDDHPAVRQERARGAAEPDRLPEAPRIRPRLPPRARMVEGQDPHPVPQLDLLRRGRVRDRVRREDLLQLRARRLRRQGRPLRLPASPARGGAARRDHLLSRVLLTARQPRACDRASQSGALEDARAGRDRRDPVRGLNRRAGADPIRDHPAEGGVRRPLLHLLAAPAGRRLLRSRPGLRRWPPHRVDPRSRAPEGDRAGGLRQHRRHRADRLRGRDRQRDRRGPRDGRRRGLRQGALQPRHQRPPPARAPRSSPSRSRPPSSRASPPPRSSPPSRRSSRSRRGSRRRARPRSSTTSSPSPTTATATTAPSASSTRRRTPTTPSTPSSASRSGSRTSPRR